MAASLEARTSSVAKPAPLSTDVKLVCHLPGYDVAHDCRLAHRNPCQAGASAFDLALEALPRPRSREDRLLDREDRVEVAGGHGSDLDRSLARRGNRTPVAEHVRSP
jgi:hypothetical protein